MKNLHDVLSILAKQYPFLKDSLCDEHWISQNRGQLVELFPEVWTHIANVSLLPIMYQLKVLGCDWKTEDQLACCFAVMEQVGIVHRDGEFLLRRGR